MSHVIDGRLRVRDLDVLDEVLARHAPHLELRRDQKTHAWWGRFEGDSTPPPGRDPKDYGKCEHAIGRKGHAPSNGSGGEWEIGLVKALDGDGYDVMLDAYGGGGRGQLAKELPTLRREYAVAVALKRARKKLARKGFTFAGREELAGGRVKLKLRRRS